MNKNLLWFVVIILILILGIYGFVYVRQRFAADSAQVGNNSSVPGCIVAGKISKNASMGPKGNFGTCCAGLKEINAGLSYQEPGPDPIGDKNGCVSKMGSGLVCSNCGDHICNASTGENKCNCAEDCK